VDVAAYDEVEGVTMLTEDDLQEILRMWLIRRIDEVARGSQSQFARLIGEHQSTLNVIINAKKGSRVRLELLLQVAQAPGVGPPLPVILTQLADTIAIADYRRMAGKPLDGLPPPSPDADLMEELAAARGQLIREQARAEASEARIRELEDTLRRFVRASEDVLRTPGREGRVDADDEAS
jgi:hypothetical protein